MDAKSVNPFHTTKIVGSYLRHHTVGASQLPDLITSVHRALTEVRQPSLPEELLTPCRFSEAICASRFRGLSGMRIPGKNLTPPHQHPTWLQPAEYPRRWGLQPDHPLTAPAYSEQRSTLAKQLGLGRKPKAEAAPIPAESAVGNGDEKIEADPSTPRGTPRSGSKSDVEAASQPKRTRQRRARSRSAPSQSEPPATPTAEVSFRRRIDTLPRRPSHQ
jgi:predicted transcriptional regulator